MVANVTHHVSSTTRGQPGRVRITWDTRKELERVDRAVEVGLQRVLDRARQFWTTEEWTEDKHPEMTGEERDKGVFRIIATEGHVTRIAIGSTADHAIFEEYGTIHRPGHSPIRNTVDYAAPQVRPAIRYALKGGYRGK